MFILRGDLVATMMVNVEFIKYITVLQRKKGSMGENGHVK